MKDPMGCTLRRLAAMLVLLTVLTSLGAALAEATEATEAVTLSLNVDELVMAVGKKASYKLTIAPKAARRAGCTYAISDESIATVDKRGAVKGVAEGVCQLTITSAYDPSVSVTLPVTVVVPVKRIAAEISADAVHVGETAVITPAYTPENATLKRAVYSSSKESVATVDKNGVVTGVGKGQAVITVLSADGYAKTRVRLRVQQQPESVQVTASTDKMVAGKRYTLKAQVLPKNADNQKVTWLSSDESIAAVNARGQVSALAPGQVTLMAVCADDPSVTGSVTVAVVRLATSVAFEQKSYDVVINQTAQTALTVGPEDATDKSVTYKSNKPKVVSVDETGLLTALAPGKATITATTADGSRRQTRTTAQVIVPVTGVSFGNNDIRVAAGGYETFTAIIRPKEATNKHMTWTSSDESVATVSGNTNRVRVSGKRWGRCQITGVTEDGGYTCSVFVDVGSLRRAVVVYDVHIENGLPYVVLVNHSNMNMTRVNIVLTGTDEFAAPVSLSSQGTTLYGVYDQALAPGEKTRRDTLSLPHSVRCDDMESLSVAVTGWETDTGYYGKDGLMYYTYEIPKASQIWSDYVSDKFLSHQNAVPR